MRDCVNECKNVVDGLALVAFVGGFCLSFCSGAHYQPPFHYHLEDNTRKTCLVIFLISCLMGW